MRLQRFVGFVVLLSLVACGSEGTTPRRSSGGNKPAGGDTDTGPVGTPCADECVIGDTQCVGTLLSTCNEGSQPGCGRWSTAMACPSNGTCRGQECVKPCSAGAQEVCTDVGVCSQGMRGCVEGFFGFCDWQLGPSAEVCNDLDDDCDGVVDNLVFAGCPKQLGVCAHSHEICGASGPACETSAYTRAAVFNGGSYASGEETACDGLDNDCDGQVDEMRETDAHNCGVCGRDCGDLACVDSQCACTGDGQCPDHQICLDGACAAGCRSDDDCEASQICNAQQLCVTGCREHSDCPSDKVCKNLLCVTGCRANSSCPKEQLCNVSNACVAGCDGDAKCNTGRICEGGQCQDGCREHGDCEIGHVCVELVCIAGCGVPGGGNEDGLTDRCPVGEACVPYSCSGGYYNCGYYECSTACYGYSCRSSDTAIYSCYGDVNHATYMSCLQACEVDSDCTDGRTCQWFTRYPIYAPIDGERGCTLACDTYVCENYSLDFLGQGGCSCGAEGSCIDAGGDACYRTASAVN